MAKIKRASTYIIISLLILIPSLFVTVSGLLDLKSEVFLTLLGTTVSAEVIETRETSSTDAGGDFMFEIRYSFEIDGKLYSYNGKSQWAALPEEQYLEAQKRGTVQVIFLPKKPEINHPLFMENREFIDTAAMTVLFLLISLVCGIVILANLHIFPHHPERH